MSGVTRLSVAANPSGSPIIISSAIFSSRRRCCRSLAGTALGFLLWASLESTTTSRSPRARACRRSRRWAGCTRLKQPAAKTRTGLLRSVRDVIVFLVRVLIGGDVVVFHPFLQALLEHVDGPPELARELRDLARSEQD